MPSGNDPVFRPAGDRGLLVEYGREIAPEINLRVRTMLRALDQAPLAGVIEVVPTYRSLLIIYDPLTTLPAKIETGLRELEARLSEMSLEEPETTVIPVCYGDDLGPDMESVTDLTGLSAEEVVRLHCAREYMIYMIGFSPGFPFLGGLDEKLTVPRLETPRTLVPAGTVAVANNQTGIYPIASPGGWRLLGRTPITLFNPAAKNPFRLKAGDAIRFQAIDRDEYERLLEEGRRS